MIPIAGSAYTYTYATMGELIAWIIGWDLILEYAVSNMAVSVGFSAHMVDLLDWFGLHPDPKWISPAYLPSGLPDLQGNMIYGPGWHFGFNWPAFIIVMLLTVVLVRGIKESAETNNIMVLLKIVAIMVFIGFSARFIHPGKLASLRSQWLARNPDRWLDRLLHLYRLRFCFNRRRGMQESAAGFASRHHRHLGGLHGALHRCRRRAHWSRALADTDGRCRSCGQYHEEAALRRRSPDRACAARLMGMISSLLVFQLGQARVWFAMSRDGLLPRIFGRVHPRFHTPDFSTWLAGFVVGIPAGLLDIGTLADLSNIGTLFAFALVAAGVLDSSLPRTGPPARISAHPAGRLLRYSQSSRAFC